MTYVPLPNIACIVGLIAGFTLILGADLARADTRPCTEEEAGQFNSDTDLPVICDIMTVTAKRIENPNVQLAQMNVQTPQSMDDLKDQSSIDLQPVSWVVTATY